MVLFECILFNNCRLCHDNPGKIEIQNDQKLIREISDCVQIKVNDKLATCLPHRICEECRNIIKTFFLYRQRIKKVDLNLRKLSKQTKSEEVINSTFIKGNIDITASRYEEIQASCPDEKPESNNEVIASVGAGTSSDAAASKFVCPHVHCKEILVSAFALKLHQSKHEKIGPFLCVACGKRFRTKNSLRCHEKIHAEVKAYECKLCKIGFSVRSNLRAHERKHHEGIRFYCSQCPKEFLSKNSLERHERTHTGIKEFQCEMCPAAFYTHKELVKHQKYHQGLRLFKCEQCYKTFFDRHHLTTHLRIHTGERPYVCLVPGCGKSFMESQKLKRHHNAKHT